MAQWKIERNFLVQRIELLLNDGRVLKYSDFSLSGELSKDNFFPKVSSEAEFNEVLLRVAEDILHRIEVIDREELESEFTMHDLSEPYWLDGAASRLVRIFLKNSSNPASYHS